MSYRVCIICSGNICRSPMGDVVLRRRIEEAGLADEVVVDSAGTGGWHEGDPADPRTLAALERAGYDGASHRARQFRREWFAERDLVVVADRGHLRELRRLAPTSEDAAKVRLLREFDDDAVAAGTLEIDDPYYGGDDGFDRCLTEVEAACAGLAAHLAGELRGRTEEPETPERRRS